MCRAANNKARHARDGVSRSKRSTRLRRNGARSRDAASRTTHAGFQSPLGENLFEELEGARILRLAEPEHRLLADGGVLVVAGLVDQQRHALVLRQLAQRK